MEDNENIEEFEIHRKKEFTYRGKTIEELKKLNIREFAKFLPSRERRTLMRNSENAEKFVIKSKKYNEKNKPIRTHKRELIIVPEMVGMTIYVHSGQNFEIVKVINEMIGHRLGEFVMTRKPVKHGAAGIGATKSSASRSVK